MENVMMSCNGVKLTSVLNIGYRRYDRKSCKDYLASKLSFFRMKTCYYPYLLEMLFIWRKLTTTTAYYHQWWINRVLIIDILLGMHQRHAKYCCLGMTIIVRKYGSKNVLWSYVRKTYWTIPKLINKKYYFHLFI